MITATLMKEIRQLGNRNAKYQEKAAKKICSKFFDKKNKNKCIDIPALTKLIPTHIRFLRSTSEMVQQEGAYFMMVIATASSPNDVMATALAKANSKLIVESNGGISALIKLLSSPYPAVVEQSMSCMGNIAVDFPEEFVAKGVLSPLIKCLKEFALNDCILLAGVGLLKNLSGDCENNIPHIIEAGSVALLLKHLESTNRNIVQESLEALINIISCNANCCRDVVEHEGALKSIRNLLCRLSSIRLLAVKFIEKMIEYGEVFLVIAIKEGIIDYVVNEFNNGINNAEMKIRLINIFRHIITPNSRYVRFLIRKENFVSILMNNLQISDELTILVLTTLNDIIHGMGYSTIEDKMRRCDGKKSIQHLLRDNKNEKIQELATMINEFVVHEPEVRSSSIIKVERSLIAADAGERVSTEGSELPNIELRRKRLHDAAKATEHLTRSKRPRNVLEPADIEQLRSSVRSDDVNDIEVIDSLHDFDDPSRNSSAVSSVASRDETTGSSLNSHSPLVSFPYPVVNLAFPDRLSSSPDNCLQNHVSFPPFKYLCRNPNSFAAFEYYEPSKDFIKSCCDKLGLTFDRQKYHDILSKINFPDGYLINSNSQPASFLPMIDGFGCLSIFLTGEEKYAEQIRDRTRMKFSKDMFALKVFDQQKLMDIGSDTLTNEHLKTISAWLECRIMVFENDSWQLFGKRDAGNNSVPVFVLHKEIIDNKIVYTIVTSLKD